jgi:2-iminobutanoate/2-iminopropanoate deaminase
MTGNKRRRRNTIMANEAIVTNNAPAAIGPYSVAIKSGNVINVSGQLPIDPATGEFAGDDITSQTRQSLTNVKSVLEAAGATMANVAQATVLLDSIADFGAMNEVYGEFFSAPYPARAAFEVAALPKGAKVEIEVVAYL